MLLLLLHPDFDHWLPLPLPLASLLPPSHHWQEIIISSLLPKSLVSYSVSRCSLTEPGLGLGTQPVDLPSENNVRIYYNTINVIALRHTSSVSPL